MIDLPSDCALIAVMACYQLARGKVVCRPLAITYKLKPVHRHIVVIFEFEGQLRGYDRDGTVSLDKALSWKSTPSKIAKTWAIHPSNDFPFKVYKGDWY